MCRAGQVECKAGNLGIVVVAVVVVDMVMVLVLGYGTDVVVGGCKKLQMATVALLVVQV